MIASELRRRRSSEMHGHTALIALIKYSNKLKTSSHRF